MTPANGQSSNIITLSLNGDPHLMQNLYASLEGFDYHIRAANNPDEASQLLKTYAPEAIVAIGDQQNIAAFFKSVKERYKNKPGCPLLMQISDQPVFIYAADLIISSASLSQVQTIIALKAENAQLKKENQRLAEAKKRLKDQLQNHKSSSSDINFLKNAIVWNVAHELRTPLLQVKSAVALLAEDVGNNAVLVELALGATTRLETVVKDITLLNDLINESVESRSFEAVLMREVVDSAVRNLRRSWQHKKDVDRIKIQIPDYLPPAYGDKQRLGIAIQLLMDNALKFSKKEVEVALQSRDSKIMVSVKDYGIGIPKDKVEKITEAFYQVDSSITKRHGGIGIGLAIVHFILQRHNTELKVETEEGQGSTFSFDLPIARL